MHIAIRLTPEMASRKLQVLDFIQRYFAAHAVGPSLGEIAAAVGTNRNRAHDAVHRLAREGRIHRTPGVHRSIRPLSAQEEAIRQLRASGYVVTNGELTRPPDLDHHPEPAMNGESGADGTGENITGRQKGRRRQGQRRQGQRGQGQRHNGRARA